MRPADVLTFATTAMRGFRLRTTLVLLAMAIGVCSVITLTSLGEGARHYVITQFSSLGANLLIVLPGRNETTGGAPPLLGATPRDLTLDDAESLLQSRAIARLAPIVVGAAPVSRQQRDREVSILGTTATFFQIRKLQLQNGRFLPPGRMDQAQPVCVLGAKLSRELFGRNSNPLGQWVRIGTSRFRVIGRLRQEGLSLGVDLDDIALIPVAAAQSLFNTDSLFRIIIEARSRHLLQQAQNDILRLIRKRHDGEDDVTIISQNAILATFDRIFLALTLTVGGIAAISLVVAGILIMNVMLITVAQRTAEIGLLKALGSRPGQIMLLFLAEAALLSAIGAVLGIGLGIAANAMIEHLIPDLSIGIPAWSLATALVVAFGTGLLFGLIPARRAARLDPILALGRR